MLIFDNRDDNGVFSVILRDKFTVSDTNVYLKLTKSDNSEFAYYTLTNTSTSLSYKTFSIPVLGLEEGQYLAEIFEGVPLVPGECRINEPRITVGTWYNCNAVDVNSEVSLEAEVLLSSFTDNGNLIYSTYCRIDGETKNTVYSTTTNYTTYNK